MPDIMPRLAIPPAPFEYHADGDPLQLNWHGIPQLPPFTLADGSGPARQQTIARACYSVDALFVRFDCQDRDIWGTYTERDDPIYDEEVVEIFLAPGPETPVDYYEIEVSPDGILLDVKIHNPGSGRSTLQANFAWNCPGIRWTAQRDDARHVWSASLAIPWSGIGVGNAIPPVWRANLYRIERPRDSSPEFSCWSPTMSDPADFHRPEYFGFFDLVKDV